MSPGLVVLTSKSGSSLRICLLSSTWAMFPRQDFQGEEQSLSKGLTPSSSLSGPTQMEVSKHAPGKVQALYPATKHIWSTCSLGSGQGLGCPATPSLHQSVVTMSGSILEEYPRTVEIINTEYQFLFLKLNPELPLSSLFFICHSYGIFLS